MQNGDVSTSPSSSRGTPARPDVPTVSGPRELVRLRLDLAYDGTSFAGWAPQPGLRTVAGELGTALATVLRRAAPVPVTAAGRTDSGVHARGQVAHVDVAAVELEPLPGRSDRTAEDALVSRLSGILPPDVVVRAVTRAPAGFDARFSATERRYLYRLADPTAERDPLRRHDTVRWHRPLDLDAMNAAARPLLGLKDFAAFCKRREGATTIRTLLEFSWLRADDGVIAATVRADAFCHSMVRALVGSVVAVGEGRRPADWPTGVQAAAAQGDGRGPGVLVMPAHGLSLQEVVYPPDGHLARRAGQTRARRGVGDVDSSS